MNWGALLGDPRSPSYPLVRSIVADLRRDYALWCDKVQEYEVAASRGTAGEPDETADVLAAEVQALAVDIQSYVAEINYLGVAFDVRRLFIEREEDAA